MLIGKDIGGAGRGSLSTLFLVLIIGDPYRTKGANLYRGVKGRGS